MLVPLRTRRDAAPRAEPRPAKRSVALVVMPVHLPNQPSLGVATLAAELRRRGHRVDVHCLNVEAAAEIGLADYEVVGNESSWVRNVGEWLFADREIAPGSASVDEMRAFLRRPHVEIGFEPFPELDLSRLRARCDALIARWARDIAWERYDVVGFTVMFQQLNASLRLASAIKKRAPSTRVVFGGCSMERPMGDVVLARHRFVDAVFSGYGDRSLPRWVEALPDRSDAPIVDDGPFDLDELPIPTFDDYLDALRRHGLDRRIVPHILLETSRGCWYGEKHHCTFCGMNGLQMKFRQKSSERAFEEVQALSRYGHPLWTTDNILPLDYFDTLLPRLSREGVRFDAFYEIKSNCRRSQLEALARAGITRLQPGIESLSTQVLEKMRKGVTGVQNVWFLRAAEELSLGCQWNVLWGFPGEDPAEYARMARLFPKLAHLQAPLGSGKIHLLRFSPNHSQAERLGFRDLKPHASYALAFGAHERLDDQAYLFDFAYQDGRRPEDYTRDVDAAAARWRRLKLRPFAPRCEVFVLAGRRVLFDTRRLDRVGVARPRVRILDDDTWALLAALESPVRRAKLEREWSRSTPLGPLLDALLRDGLVLEADDRVVRLVVVRSDPRPLAELARVVRAKARDALRAARRRL